VPLVKTWNVFLELHLDIFLEVEDVLLLRLIESNKEQPRYGIEPVHWSHCGREMQIFAKGHDLRVFSDDLCFICLRQGVIVGELCADGRNLTASNISVLVQLEFNERERPILSERHDIESSSGSPFVAQIDL